MAQLTYPGVYIEEFAPGAPIAGVGTNTAAFLGPAALGPMEPTKITSWDAFLDAYTGSDKGPLDGSFVWYAVRGFFENGGTVCYIARVGNESRASATLMDGGSGNGKPTLLIQGREPGPVANVKVDVDEDNAVSNRSLFRPTASGSTIAGDKITASSGDDAAQFLPGDRLTWSGINATEPPVIVQRVSGPVIQLQSPVGSPPTGTVTVRLSDLKVADGSDSFLLNDDSNLGPGSVVTLSQTGVTDDVVLIKQIIPQQLPDGSFVYRVSLRNPVKHDFSLGSAVTLKSHEFKLTVKDGTTTIGGPYPNLSMDPEHPRYAPKVLAADAGSRVDAVPAQPPSVQQPPKNQPRKVTGTAVSGGQLDNPGTLNATDYRNALERLETVDDVNMVMAPDRTDAGVQTAIVAHCELMMDRFAILDSKPGVGLFGTGSVEEQRNGVTSPNGYAGLYYPWLLAPAATGGGLVLVPPSGHVAGIYARTDELRGVHKAPAGEEATVNGAIAVERPMSDVDQGQLNLQGINVIRVFRPGGRPVVWGARTTASNASWAYVSTRRLFEYLEESIQEGIDWSVFEPHNPALWKKLKRTITAFLTNVWRDGALFGETPEKAFYVRIDEVLNPPSERELGRLHIEIGCVPSYPAEFVVVRIGIWEGGGEINES